jgi:hypothetical protein
MLEPHLSCNNVEPCKSMKENTRYTLQMFKQDFKVLYSSGKINKNNVGQKYLQNE